MTILPLSCRQGLNALQMGVPVAAGVVAGLPFCCTPLTLK